ncbi:MAG: methionine biosynthesis protein MetW [Thermodesulfovibrionales bacterium]|nr:methionine biosynthesis protein MetW [Thermodesulfovibrionales bacterium]
MILNNTPMPEEYDLIINLVDKGASVLDLGCGNGELLLALIREKGVKGQGIEIDENAIYSCVSKGLNVFQDDLDNGLIDYYDSSFDYVIMNQTLQELINPHLVLKEALRVGKYVIVSFPNFAYYKGRFQLFFCGRAPVTNSLPNQWYDTPNLHFLSITDFIDYCKDNTIQILESFYLPKTTITRLRPNFFAYLAIMLITKK